MTDQCQQIIKRHSDQGLFPLIIQLSKCIKHKVKFKKEGVDVEIYDILKDLKAINLPKEDLDIILKYFDLDGAINSNLELLV